MLSKIRKGEKFALTRHKLKYMHKKDIKNSMLG